jgi:hypothetical protein
MGVYAEVIHGGRVAIGDTVAPPDAPRASSRIGHWLRFFAFLARSAPIVLRGSGRPAGGESRPFSRRGHKGRQGPQEEREPKV